MISPKQTAFIPPPPSPPTWPRAAATASTNCRAAAVRSAHRPSRTAALSTSALPTPMAAAPARIHAPAFSRVTPPVGISRSLGIGASTSAKNAGPSEVAGNTLTMSAPACQAA